MFFPVLSSLLYASLLNLCVCILLWRYLLAAYLCWGRMVGSVPGNGVSEGGFSAREYLYIVFSFVYRDV